MASTVGDTSSSCSLRGSTESHRPATGLSRCMYQGKDLDSFVFTARDVKTAQLVGDRSVVCETEAAHKANKLNRSEQCKLEHYKNRVKKEESTHQRQFRHIVKMMQARSDKLKTRINQIEEEYETNYTTRNWRPLSHQPRVQSRILTKRPRSQPVRSSSFENTETRQCAMCAQIQKIVRMYEQEKHSTDVQQNTSEHSTCLFSDMQVRTFLQLLEAKHFQEVPNLATKLRETGNSLGNITGNGKAIKLSRHEIENDFEKKSIENRIKGFLVKVDKFNKENGSIPETVKKSLEKIRYNNATLLKPSPLKRLSLREEAELTLNIKTI